MEEWIIELADRAKELLSDATELDETLDGIEANTHPTTDQLAKIEKCLSAICEALTTVVNVLRQPSGPLSNLVQKLDGVKVSSDAKDALERFLVSHKRTLALIGVQKELVDRVLEDLRQEIENSSVKLDEPQTISSDDADAFIESLEQLRDIICEIHQNAQLFNKVWDPKLPRTCVQGVIGACVIVIDITGVFTVPDVTGFILFKAVMSTWSGYKKIKKTVDKISGLWSNLKSRVTSNDRLKQLSRERPPKIQLKKGGDASSKK